MRFYKRFYKINDIAKSNKFLIYIGIIVKKYNGPCQIIVIKAKNHFNVYKILKTCVGVVSNSYRHYNTNNIEKLLKKMAQKTSL